MTDAYDSSLWDIDPICQVAAICDNDTVVLDGARGATIQWSKFDCVWYETGHSWKRMTSSIVVRFGWVFLVVALFFGVSGILALLITGKFAPSSLSIFLGVLFLLIWFHTVLVTPSHIRNMLGGKITNIQGALYGVEGYLNPATVERLIFGGNFGRFKWSTNGSPLSRSRINEHKEKVGIDPCLDIETREKVTAARVAKTEDMRVSGGLLLAAGKTH